ncbi:MAG: flagellin, partial [Clostridioides difficile]|nr:flagellin [Clostridioides difficile]
MRINNNVNALIANNQMNKNTALQSRSMEKLSS